jgi:hypothetical protein
MWFRRLTHFLSRKKPEPRPELHRKQSLTFTPLEDRNAPGTALAVANAFQYASLPGTSGVVVAGGQSGTSVLKPAQGASDPARIGALVLALTSPPATTVTNSGTITSTSHPPLHNGEELVVLTPAISFAGWNSNAWALATESSASSNNYFSAPTTTYSESSSPGPLPEGATFNYGGSTSGTITAPDLYGQALVAVQDHEYDGVVATIQGTQWNQGDLAALIQWGDGDMSTGTLVNTGGSWTVQGDHTYSHAGEYALAVQVQVNPTLNPSSSATASYAAGLAMVLAPTDHLDVEKVNSVSSSGGGLLNETVTTGTMGFTASTGGSFGYTLAESVETPDGSYNLTRNGTFSFSLTETGSIYVQPNSVLNMTVSESSNRSELDATPSMYGNATITGTENYSLSQIGIGANYTWLETESAQATRQEQETLLDGTHSATETKNTTQTRQGMTNFWWNWYTLSWAGNQATAWNESGYHEANSYSLIQTDTSAGTIWGSETGNTESNNFYRTAGDANNYTLTQTSTNAGGGSSESGTGSYSDYYSAVGIDPYSGGTFSKNRSLAQSTNLNSTVAGIVTSSSILLTSTQAETDSGDEISGSFTQATGGYSSRTKNSFTNNQGDSITSAETLTVSTGSVEVGNTGAGTYYLNDSASSFRVVVSSDVNKGILASWTDTSSTTQQKIAERQPVHGRIPVYRR